MRHFCDSRSSINQSTNRKKTRSNCIPCFDPLLWTRDVRVSVPWRSVPKEQETDWQFIFCAFLNMVECLNIFFLSYWNKSLWVPEFPFLRNGNSEWLPISRNPKPGVVSLSQESRILAGSPSRNAEIHNHLPQMIDKICLNTSACSKTHRNERSSGFPFLWTQNPCAFQVPRNENCNWHQLLVKNRYGKIWVRFPSCLCDPFYLIS